jgi:hypothetical protein
VVLPDLLPSTFGNGVPVSFEIFHDYNGTLTVTDAAGRTAVQALPQFTTEHFLLNLALPPVAIVEDLQITSEVRDLNGTSIKIDGTITMALKGGGPPPLLVGDMVAAFNVVVNDVIWTDIVSTHPQSFTQFGTAFTALPGPWVLTDPTDAVTGQTSWGVTVNGLTPGDRVVINPVLVQYIEVGVYDPLNPDFGSTPANLIPSSNYGFADTPKDKRSVQTIF